MIPADHPRPEGGIWTMTEAEFREELRKAHERAYDHGFTDCNAEYGKQRKDPGYPIMRHNPYAVNYGCPDCGDADWACDCRWRT